MQKRKKSISDSQLNKLWRRAVLCYRKHDPFNFVSDVTQLECHHYIRRRNYLLRWDYRNGIPLTRESHSQIHLNKMFELKLLKYLDIGYLKNMCNYTKKKYFQIHNLNDNEFRILKKNELLEIIKEMED